MSGESRKLLDRASELGLALSGIAPVRPVPRAAEFESWLRRGLHGDMDYLAERAADRMDPDRLLTGVKSAVMVAVNYARGPAPRVAPGEGKVARYAWGRDYHNVATKRLRKLQKFAEREFGMQTYRSVDTGPVLERPYAELAGLGWTGRHTLLINPDLGSWLLLGVLLVDRELDYSTPETDACGSCRLCVDACPTEAIDWERREVDARKCISYLTIENRGPVQRELRPLIGSWMFGCDICQEVCPHNGGAPLSDDPAYPPMDKNAVIGVESVLAATDDELKARFWGSPVTRAQGAGLKRNALIVAGNQKHDALLPLYRTFLEDPDPVLRAQAVWTLGELGQEGFVEKLRTDPDAAVREEVEAVLSR